MAKAIKNTRDRHPATLLQQAVSLELAADFGELSRAELVPWVFQGTA